MAAITDLKISRVTGSENELLAVWTCWDDHIDHFEIQWYYWLDKQQITERASSVPATSYTWKVKQSNGKSYKLFQSTYDAPEDANLTKVKCRVRAYATDHRVAVGTNKDGSTKYENKPWFETTAWGYSNEIVPAWNLAAPAAPTNVAAALSGFNVQLTWQLSDERATHVAIWRSTDGKAAAKVKTLTAKTSGSWRDTSCSKGHTYRYKLKAYNQTGNAYSEFSSVAHVEEVPLAPNNLKAKLAAADAVRLDWSHQAYSGMNNYVLSYTDTPGDFANNSINIHTINVTGTKHVTVSGLERGKTWYFRVQSVSSGGTSVYSAMVSMKLSPDPKTVVPTPAQPTLNALLWDSKAGALKIVTTVATTRTDERFEIQLTTSGSFTSDAVRTITVDGNGSNVRKKGDVYSYGSASTGWTQVGKGVIYSLTDAQRSATYRCRVRRANGSKYSAWSSTLTCTVPADTSTVGAATLLALFADGPWLRAAATVPTSLATKLEFQLSTVSGEFSDQGVQTIVYENGWRTVYSDGTTWQGSKFTGATARGTGVVFAFTSLDASTKYWVRCRAYADSQAGSWSTTKSATTGANPDNPEPLEAPQAPSALKAELQDGSDDNVKLTFSDPFDPAEAASFEIQWTSNARAFSDNAIGDISQATWEPETTGSARKVARTYTVTSLDRGAEWHFRVRKYNDAGSSSWAEASAGDSYASKYVAKCLVPSEAEELSAPSTVATDADIQLGGTALLTWRHSSAQDSDQTAWEVELTVTTSGETDTLTESDMGADSTLAVTLADGESFGEGTLDLDDGSTVAWRVRTQGVAEDVWSPWSGSRTINVWAPPAAGIALADGALSGVGDDDPLTRLPLVIEVTAQEAAEGNEAASWWAEVISLQAYEVQGADGSDLPVAEGEVLWSGTINANDAGFSAEGWHVELTAADISLPSGMSYAVRGGCTSAMGLRSEVASQDFSTLWETGSPIPSATIAFDAMAYEAHIWPRCPVIEGAISDDDPDAQTTPDPSSHEATATFDVTELPATLELGAEVTDQGSVAVRVGDTWLEGTSWSLDPADATVTIVEGAPISVPCQVTVTWETAGQDEGGVELLAGALLSVWRVGAGGELALVASGLPNDGLQEVVDPHASFGTCRYRVVASDPTTGLSGSTDVEAGSDVGIIAIQWDGDAKMLELPYNIKVDETRSPDVALISYAGRRHPVAYRGTQRGETGSWKTEIIKGFDAEKLELVRQAAYQDCYVREPHGSGYWASVSVRVAHDYQTAAVGVSLEVTRIESPAGEVG